MVAYWIKIEFERNEYVVDLDQVNTFVCHPHKKIDFYLPNTSQMIVINYYNHSEDYKKIIDYINHITDHSVVGNWIKFLYERKEYVVDLNRIASFCYSPQEKISFWLPGVNTPIILTKEADKIGYSKILNFVKDKTGQSFI